MTIDITKLSVGDIAAKIRSRELKCVDVAQAFIANIETNRHLNAVIYFNRDQVLFEAAQLDKEADRGDFRGRIHGVPIAIKDNIHVKDVPNTAGTPSLCNFVPKQDAPVYAALRKEGALFIAKLNMHELAFGVTTNNAAFGKCGNACNAEYSAGGSSGGSGSAVGSFLAPAALGTDTGGSVRIPSSVNGIAGLRPTFARYSNEGITPIVLIRDTSGPMAHNVDDLILLDECITGQKFESAKQPSSLSGLRIGIASYLCDNLDPEVALAFDRAKHVIKTAGAELVDVNIERVKQINSTINPKLLFCGPKYDLADYLRKYEIGLTVEEVAAEIASPDVQKIYAGVLSTTVTFDEYKETIEVTRPALIKAYKDAFTEHDICALMFPTLCRLPIRFDDPEVDSIETLDEFIRNTDSDSNAGLPSLSLNMGKSKLGLPIGLNFDGLENSDHLLLAIGSITEKLLRL